MRLREEGGEWRVRCGGRVKQRRRETALKGEDNEEDK